MRFYNQLQNKKSDYFGGLTRFLPMLFVAIVMFMAGTAYGQGSLTLPWTSKTASGLPADLDYRSVEQVYDLLKQDFDGQLDVNKLLEGIRAGLANATGDPYTEYMTKDEATEFNQELNGSFSGIGAELSKDKTANMIIVVAPINGFPAEKAGLKAKDAILEIDGQNAYGLSVSEAVNRIRGSVGTDVTLKILRDGNELTFTITRQEITVPSVTSEILEGNIGLIEISRFGEDTAELATTAAKDFKTKGVKGVIVDVRGNPGGLLQAAVGTASLWLPAGKTVLTERQSGRITQTYTATGDALLTGLPTAVLIDEGSASASEILAGALKDNGVATLVGIKSFGKGSVQQLDKLNGGGLLKVTIARWYTPNGRNIDKEGIEPDQKVERNDEDLKAGTDSQKDAAIQLLKK